MASAVTLGDLKLELGTTMTDSEAKLAAKLATIANGDTVTSIDLLAYQMELASNSLTVSTCSGIAKERSDTLKGIVQKF